MTLTLEDYLRNPPKLLEEMPEEVPEPQPPSTFAGHGPIGDYERAWLKRLQNEPGYLIIFKMLNNIVQRFENSARLLSTADPLGNKDAVANAWAYAGVAKAIKEQLEREVAMEVVQAKSE
jgi:hypothetical protein